MPIRALRGNPVIRLLVKLGAWLDSRFPARVVVKESDYRALNQRIEALEAKLQDVQKAAVHKDAVRDVIEVVKTLKADLQSFKVSLGLNRMTSPEDVLATLNGESLNERE